VFRGEAATSQNDHRSRFPALEADPAADRGAAVDRLEAAGHTIGISRQLGGRFGGAAVDHQQAGLGAALQVEGGEGLGCVAHPGLLGGCSA